MGMVRFCDISAVVLHSLTATQASPGEIRLSPVLSLHEADIPGGRRDHYPVGPRRESTVDPPVLALYPRLHGGDGLPGKFSMRLEDEAPRLIPSFLASSTDASPRMSRPT